MTVEEALEAVLETDHLVSVTDQGTVYDRPDDSVEARTVAACGENSDTHRAVSPAVPVKGVMVKPVRLFHGPGTPHIFGGSAPRAFRPSRPDRLPGGALLIDRGIVKRSSQSKLTFQSMTFTAWDGEPA
ncbi:hypothetical protein [Streptomyces venezuelae]|uniref:hypothetical protein n=1 Tax=Streptomyces venezuelae TaxID=54571 RepID=UPI001CC249FC|nr:hypothetical protein [Streptomyces venezuelae]